VCGGSATVNIAKINKANIHRKNTPARMAVGMGEVHLVVLMKGLVVQLAKPWISQSYSPMLFYRR
jgi:hypothetical protein